MINNLKKNWFLYLIIAQPLLDIIAFFQANNVIGSIAGYSRLLVMCILPLVVLYKTPKKKSFILLMMVIGGYCLLHAANSYRLGYISIFEDIAYMARIVQMPILAISFIYLMKDDSYKNMTSKAFIINIVVIIISIAISMITNTGEYTYDIYKLGLKGWFSNANSQSIIIVTLIPLALEVLTRKKNILLFSIGTILAWFLMISNGTKVAYLSIYLIFGGFIVYYIMEFFLHRENFKRFNTVAIIAYSLLLVISYVGYDKTPRYEMTHGYESAREEDQAEMDKEFDKMTDGSNPTLDQMLNNPVQREWILRTYDKLINPSLVEKYGTETVLREYGYLPDAWELTDTREAKILYSDMLYKKSDMLTKIVGFEYSHVLTSDGSFDLENDYHAVFYYYGYLGFGLYMGFLLYFLVLVLKKVIVDFKGAFTSFNFALILTYLVQLGAAQFSGAILRRPNVSIYLSIIVALIYYQCKINKKDETIK